MFMVSLQIKDVKNFMNRLLLSDYFDAFHVSEASFVTFATFHMDGRLKKEYYTAEEQELLHLQEQEYSTWKQLRPFCLSLIKGTHSPLEFKLIFRLSPSNTEKLLRQANLDFSLSDIAGLFVNIHFQTGSLTCTTGTSLHIFTLDRSLDRVWDCMVQKFLADFTVTVQ